jgi:hypothetical protein
MKIWLAFLLDISTITGMEARKIVEYLGGTCKTAKILCVAPPSVSKWIARGFFPRARQMYLELRFPELRDEILPPPPATARDGVDTESANA